MTLAGADRLIAAARSANLPLLDGTMFVHHPRIVRLLQAKHGIDTDG